MNGQRASLRDSNDGFTMDFSVEIVEDTYAALEEVMRLSAHGRFREARQLAKETLLSIMMCLLSLSKT